MTTPMMPLDHAENDRLLLDAEDRRQRLIEIAVSSFAPHLADKLDVEVVHLHSTNASLRKAIRTLFEGSKVIVVEHCLGGNKARKGINEIQEDSSIHLKLPPHVDIVATKANLNYKTSLFAAQLKADAVVLPEAEDYLRARLKKVGALVIVGADQGP